MANARLELPVLIHPIMESCINIENSNFYPLQVKLLFLCQVQCVPEMTMKYCIINKQAILPQKYYLMVSVYTSAVKPVLQYPKFQQKVVSKNRGNTRVIDRQVNDY